MQHFFILLVLITFLLFSNCTEKNKSHTEEDKRVDSNVSYFVADTLFQLNNINSYPIKIDGGCSFFTYDSLPIERENYILIYSATKKAFIEINQRTLLFRHQKRKGTDSGYVDYFENKDAKATIFINRIEKLQSGSIRKGILELNRLGRKKTFKIHGIVQASDIYNGWDSSKDHYISK